MRLKECWESQNKEDTQNNSFDPLLLKFIKFNKLFILRKLAFFIFPFLHVQFQYFQLVSMSMSVSILHFKILAFRGEFHPHISSIKDISYFSFSNWCW